MLCLKKSKLLEMNKRRMKMTNAFINLNLDQKVTIYIHIGGVWKIAVGCKSLPSLPILPISRSPCRNKD